MTITWTFEDESGNISTQNQEVTINDQTQPEPDIADLPDISGNCEVTVSTLPTATDNCDGSITATTSDNLTFNQPGTFLITWTYSDEEGNQTSQSQNVTIVNSNPVAQTKDITVELNESGTATITPADIDNGSYDDCELVSLSLDITDFTTSDIGENTVILTVTDNIDQTDSETAIVTIIWNGDVALEIPNFVSPNNDGKNDLWEIKGVETLQGFHLEIFNSFGEIIYSSDNYDNTWDATYNGKELPNGNYYYIFAKDDQTYKGFISVVR